MLVFNAIIASTQNPYLGLPNGLDESIYLLCVIPPTSKGFRLPSMPPGRWCHGCEGDYAPAFVFMNENQFREECLIVAVADII